MKSFLALFSIVLLTTGCWNKDFNEPGRTSINRKPTEMTIGSGFQRTWAVTQAIVSKFPVKQRKLNRKTGQAFMVTDWIPGKSDTLYHGFDVNRIPYVIRYQLYIYVMADRKKGGTRIVIKNVEQYMDDVVTAGVDIQGSVQTWINTNTSTLKENSLLLQIDKYVRDPKFKVSAR